MECAGLSGVLAGVRQRGHRRGHLVGRGFELLIVFDAGTHVGDRLGFVAASRACGGAQFLKPSRVCVGEIHRIRDHGRGQLRLAGTVVFGAALLFLAGALGELVHQPGCAALFDGANHLVDGVGRADMPVCGAHVVDGVGQVCHGFSYGGIAVQFGRGAENGGKLCGVANRTGQMRGV